MAGLMNSALIVLFAGCVLSAPVEEQSHVDLKMPGVQPQVADTYLCHAMKMGDKPTYITGFVPHANMSTAHHMLLYGCKTPGDKQEVWNCGEMGQDQREFNAGPVCATGSSIIYAWAMDAPSLTLPKDVAFKVGGDTDIQYLVLQVHYKDVSKFTGDSKEEDKSGITLQTTPKPQPKSAGVYLLGTGGELPPRSTEYMETACSFGEPMVLHPFGFRTHTHTHGEVVSGYRVRDGKWEEIGRISPKKPQMFYPVSDSSMTIEKGDLLAARCTMVNNEDRVVKIGSTQNDEMCNFYIMYWVEGDQTPQEKNCFTNGPPSWNWMDFGRGLNAQKAPKEASIIPGTDKIIEASERIFDENMRESEAEMMKLLASLEGRFEDYPNNYDGFGYENFEPRQMRNMEPYGDEDWE